MKINKQLIQFISICVILLQINSMFLKDKPSVLPEMTTETKEMKTDDCDCIPVKKICPTEPTMPKSPKAPRTFCKKVKETCGEKVVLKKEGDEKVTKKEVMPIEKTTETEATKGDDVEEVIEKEVKPAKITTTTDDGDEEEIETVTPKKVAKIIKEKVAGDKIKKHFCDIEEPDMDYESMINEITEKIAEKEAEKKGKDVKPKKEIVEEYESALPEVVEEEEPAEIKITPAVIPVLKAKNTVAEKTPTHICVEHKKIGADILKEIKGGLCAGDFAPKKDMVMDAKDIIEPSRETDLPTFGHKCINKKHTVVTPCPFEHDQFFKTEPIHHVFKKDCFAHNNEDYGFGAKCISPKKPEKRRLRGPVIKEIIEEKKPKVEEEEEVVEVEEKKPKVEEEIEEEEVEEKKPKVEEVVEEVEEESPKEIEIKKPKTCGFNSFKFPDNAFKCDWDHHCKKEVFPAEEPKVAPVLKAGKVEEEKPKTIDMKAHIGGFIDNNANKIKGISAHYLDAIDALTDKKIKQSLDADKYKK